MLMFAILFISYYIMLIKIYFVAITIQRITKQKHYQILIKLSKLSIN
jgi:hypothetical protein